MIGHLLLKNNRQSDDFHETYFADTSLNSDFDRLNRLQNKQKQRADEDNNDRSSSVAPIDVPIETTNITDTNTAITNINDSDDDKDINTDNEIDTVDNDDADVIAAAPANNTVFDPVLDYLLSTVLQKSMSIAIHRIRYPDVQKNIFDRYDSIRRFLEHNNITSYRAFLNSNPNHFYAMRYYDDNEEYRTRLDGCDRKELQSCHNYSLTLKYKGDTGDAFYAKLYHDPTLWQEDRLYNYRYKGKLP